MDRAEIRPDGRMGMTRDGTESDLAPATPLRTCVDEGSVRRTHRHCRHRRRARLSPARQPGPPSGRAASPVGSPSGGRKRIRLESRRFSKAPGSRLDTRNRSRCRGRARTPPPEQDAAEHTTRRQAMSNSSSRSERSDANLSGRGRALRAFARSRRDGTCRSSGPWGQTS